MIDDFFSSIFCSLVFFLLAVILYEFKKKPDEPQLDEQTFTTNSSEEFNCDEVSYNKDDSDQY
jgi:hypothetical protein